MASPVKSKAMKYSLRSLIIGITLFCVCLPIWLNHRRYCLSKVNHHSLHSSPMISFSTAEALAKERDRKLRHVTLAGEYRRAVWMPWLRLWIDDQEPAP